MLNLTSLLASLSFIFVSELGDKTFFIAAIMAMTNSRVTVFLGAISALILMTLLSVGLGLTANFIPKSYIHYGSIVIFILFGLKMLWDARFMSGDEGQEEYKEVEKTLEEKRLNYDNSLTPTKKNSTNLTSVKVVPNGNAKTTSSIDSLKKDPETGIIFPQTSLASSSSVNIITRIKRFFMRFVSLAFIETLTMTLVAEWGDRSQISTVLLAAKEDPLSVSIGAIVGHAICSMIAVIGGRMVAQMISVKTVTYLGGIIFIGFAIIALVIGD